jgi:dolichol-phosphate mannosyltransferase
MNLGIVIPTYCEEETIAALLQTIQAQVPDARVLVVDDSPNERTADAAAPFLDARRRIVRRGAKGGRGSAVLEGMRQLLDQDVDCIVEMDADFSHPPAQIPDLANRLSSEGLDLLIASRYLPESKITNWPASRRVLSAASNRLARAVLGVPVRDYTNGFRCYSRPAAELVTGSCGLGTGFIALSESLVALYYRGFRVGEVPTTFVNRSRGESSLDAGEIAGAVRGLARIHRLKRQLMRDGA